MTGNWKLSNELCNLANNTNLQQALYALGMIPESNVDFELIEQNGWYRGGAETYIYQFSVHHSGRSQKFIAKAMVSNTPSRKPDEQLSRWLMSRRHLSSLDIAVPHLFGFGKGLLIEEYIDFDLREWLRHSNTDLIPGSTLRKQIDDIAEKVFNSGYRPVCILPNLRISKGLPIWIDFGTDLGIALHNAVSIPSFHQMVDREVQKYRDP